MARTVRIVGVPMDYGVDRRGVDMGPSAIRYAGLADELAGAGVEPVDEGDLAVPRAEERDTGGDEIPFRAEIEAVTDRLAERVETIHEAGDVPLVLGGDHTVSIGSVGGMAANRELGVLWFDAHADSNTPVSSPSGNVHGMPIAALLGREPFADWAAPELAPEQIAYVGLRSIDDAEREWLAESGVTAYTMADVDDRGITTVVADAIEAAAAGADGLHVSIDLDWVDPQLAPGVGTPVKGGVTYREAHAAMETVASHGEPVHSLDLVEVNPILDEGNETAALAAELAASVFGKRIL